MFRQLLLCAVVGLALSAPSDKISSQLKTTLNTQGTSNAVVIFKENVTPILNKIDTMKFDSRGAKITFMKAKLEELQATSQINVLRLLSARTGTFHSLWINNRIYVKDASLELVQTIAALPEVAEVREEYMGYIQEPVAGANISIQAEWGIDKIEADQAWELPGGNNGAGVVVSTIDTGVRHTHEALRNNHRSEYGWFDPFRNEQTPSDGHGHGSHCTGTIAGAGGIGVAPGSQWVACRACTPMGLCSESDLSRCGQWIACPTLPNGQSPDCSKAPNVCSNSWVYGTGSSWYDEIVRSWHSANIIPVFGIGNDGPNCNTVRTPGDSPLTIGVGATNVSDIVTSFSSRGPANQGHIKPDLSAPGQDVRSAWDTADDSYISISGTSMATPHVTGTVALLISRNPNFSYDQIKYFLENNTDRNLGAAATCGNTPPNQFPNNIYGFGRINARKSLAAAINGF